MGDVVIGVDPSSRAMHAVVTMGDGVPSVLFAPLHQTDKPLATAQAYEWINEAVRFYSQHGKHEVYVFVEIPVMGRAGAHAMLTIAKAVGGVEAGAVRAGAKVTEVNNQTWKKVVVGKGNCGKPEIKAWCKEAWPKAYDLAEGRQDLYDAAAINRYGLHVLGLREKRVGPKKIVVKKKRSS